jgi:dihydroorotase
LGDEVEQARAALLATLTLEHLLQQRDSLKQPQPMFYI